MLKGKDVMLSIAGTLYGYADECSINLKTNTTQVSTTKYKRKSSAGNWDEYESDTNGWDVSTGYVATESQADYLALFNAWKAGEPVTVEYTPVKDKTTPTTPGATGDVEASTTAGIKMTGQAIITSISETAPVDGEVTYKIDLQGTGELVAVSLPSV